MADLANVNGLTEREYAERLFRAISRGRLIDVLDIMLQAEFCEWVEENGLLDGKPFCVSLALSANRKRDVCYWIKASLDMSGDEPLINALEMAPGVVDEIPAGWDCPHYHVPMIYLDPLWEHQE